MNVELLQKVKAHILEEPKRLFMPVVLHCNMSDVPEVRKPPCGTMACIAGWACLLKGVPHLDVHSSVAQELLEISESQAQRLFFGLSEEYKKAWDGSGSAEEAELIAARIDRFINTEGRE